MVGIVRQFHSENFRKPFALPSLLTGLRGPNSRVRAFIVFSLGGSPGPQRLAGTKNRSVMDVTYTFFSPARCGGTPMRLRAGSFTLSEARLPRGHRYSALQRRHHAN